MLENLKGWIFGGFWIWNEFKILRFLGVLGLWVGFSY
jgi:hypothetical protein